MTDKIKSNITTSYMLFVFDFSDPSNVEKANIEKEIKFPVSEVFDSQKKADSARERLGKAGFNKMLSVYFASFQTSDGFDYDQLGAKVMKQKKVFLRFIGKDKLNYLTLLINTMTTLKEPKKGLLFGDAS
jgi:hypothetical protein